VGGKKKGKPREQGGGGLEKARIRTEGKIAKNRDSRGGDGGQKDLYIRHQEGSRPSTPRKKKKKPKR